MDPKLNPKLAQQISQWGSDLLQEERKGALRDWTPEIARQLKVEFDTNLEKILHNPYFLGLKDAGTLNGPEENCLYTAHKEDILAIYEENKKRPINLVILIEGIGAGKTTLYAVMTWLEWFRLTTKYDPHQYYGMMRDEIIAFIAMNRSEAQAKRVTLQKVFPKFQTQFNLEYFPPSKRRGQEIWIPRNSTLIFAGTSSAASALGYNIYGGGVDEANCVGGKTKIKLSNGDETEIENLLDKENIELKTFNLEFGNFENGKAEKCVLTGERDVWELELENGTKLEATEETLFLYKEPSGIIRYKFLKDIEEEEDLIDY